jgi:hypothetical protein
MQDSQERRLRDTRQTGSSPRRTVERRRSFVFTDKDRLPEHGLRDGSVHRLYHHYYEDLLM